MPRPPLLRGLIAVRVPVLLALAGLGSCTPGSVSWHQAKEFDGKHFFLACNVRAEKGSIHDGMYYDTVLLPVGSAVVIRRHVPMAYMTRGDKDPAAAIASGPMVVLGDQQYGIRHIYGRDQQTAADFIRTFAAEEDPTPRLESFPADIQRAIRDAKVMRGMDREQVMMALCRPPAHMTPSLEARSWTYWRSSFDRYYVVFGDDGKVTQVHGANPPEVPPGAGEGAGSLQQGPD